ncbi:MULTISPECIES: ROK family protein [Sphingobacterium]|uniref:ROK family protein n=1 Tax=Sphingobacterium litopenaei TaxID=2763500 RepID=A0ABR7YAF5_9SPHI|nr:MULTISPECIES: ROK family protein [Sphingobacterium]MBD1428262.1 ROK family protein [Sphingobacterium litopenaei]NGM72127.1 ROK family protein [Sphingobacterium sp. SGL-16]
MSLLEDLLEEVRAAKTTITRKSALNKVKLMRTLFDKEMLTLGDLVQDMGLSFPTMNSLVLDLHQRKMLVPKDKGESIGGRKPVLYQINDGIFNVLCVEIERFAVRMVVMDNNNNVLFEPKSYPFEISTQESDIEDLVQVILQYFEDRHIEEQNISAIGLSMPGLINFKIGTNQTFYSNNSFNISDYLKQKFGKHVAMVNDVKGAAISELAYGAAQDKENVLVILMDWGIGLGIIIDGKVYMGNEGFSGEMGHMVFVDEGELCYCGKRGCLETIASGVYLVNQARADIEKGVPTLLKNLKNLADLQPQHIIQVANQGDQYAIDLIASLGNNLGKAISLLIQILNPEAVVLSGKFAKAGSLITIPIQQSLNKYTMNAIRQKCEIQLSSLDDNGYAQGLVRYTVEDYFKNNLVTLNMNN